MRKNIFGIPSNVFYGNRKNAKLYVFQIPESNTLLITNYDGHYGYKKLPIGAFSSPQQLKQDFLMFLPMRCFDAKIKIAQHATDSRGKHYTEIGYKGRAHITEIALLHELYKFPDLLKSYFHPAMYESKNK